MNKPGTKKPRRRYRLNVKKMAGALLTTALFAVVTVAAAVALKNAAEGEAALPAAGGLTVTRKVTASATSVISPIDSEQAASAPGGELSGRLIVVDAGHGGFDPGTSGPSGVREDELNLAVAQYVQAELKSRGAQVIMTRNDGSAIGDSKSADMAARRRIIEQSGSDIVISIHMNSFEDDPGVSGPLTLFMAGSQRGKLLAQAVIDSLNAALGTDGSARARDDLIILKSGSQPCVLVECGYLSNREEEARLQQPDYQKKIARAICDGAGDFFSRQ